MLNTINNLCLAALFTLIQARDNVLRLHVDTFPSLASSPQQRRVCIGRATHLNHTCLFLDTHLYQNRTERWHQFANAQVATVPRSGSTWFIHVLRDAYVNLSVQAHHYPFFSQQNPLNHIRTQKKEGSTHTFVLVRNPFDAFRSYVERRRKYPAVELTWTQFFNQWYDHNRRWIDVQSIARDWTTSVAHYEHLAVDPRAALGRNLFSDLERSLHEWAHHHWTEAARRMDPCTHAVPMHHSQVETYNNKLTTFGYEFNKCD